MAPTRELSVIKAHGTGNDFVVVIDPDDEVELAEGDVQRLCDRHVGIGADGLSPSGAGGRQPGGRVVYGLPKRRRVACGNVWKRHQGVCRPINPPRPREHSLRRNNPDPDPWGSAGCHRLRRGPLPSRSRSLGAHLRRSTRHGGRVGCGPAGAGDFPSKPPCGGGARPRRGTSMAWTSRRHRVCRQSLLMV